MKTLILTRLLLLVCLSGFLIYSKPASANIYTVTSTANSGAGTLRQAITDANANAGLDTIRFLILVAGNTFEGLAPATYAVIQVNTTLPTITGPLLIDGTSQTDTNLGSVTGRFVGVDSVVQNNINYPDVYVVPSNSFVFPSTSTGTAGNGISIDATNVTIRGLCVSGFGNTNANAGTASGNADIQVMRSATVRNSNVTITNNFLSCDPRGNFPALSYRRTLGNGVLVAGNNFSGRVSNNYFAHCGTYGVHYNGNVDNNSVGPSGTTIGNRNWIISGNQFINITTNTLVTVNKTSDAINMMKCVAFRVINNFLNDAEQVGIDMGYNSDSNFVANNTITGYVKTGGVAPQAGIRIGLCSQYDTLYRNLIYNNTGTAFKAGIWSDRSELTQTGVVIKGNSNNRILENKIYDNNSSGIVLSNNSTGSCLNNRISRNLTYNNTGLGIDLNYNATTGPTAVSVNDNGDVDGGTNNIQNFPIIDSVKKLNTTVYGIFGKAPAGSTIEFFTNDGQANKHGGLTLNYGEGKNYIGSLVEGSIDDAATGVGSYNVDGNVAVANVNMFFVMLNYSGVVNSLDSLTATAMLANNTSEFGPTTNILLALGCTITSLSASYHENQVSLNWKAICDNKFQYFEVEHSTDGRNFSRLRTVIPGDRVKLVNYEALHTNITEGKHYYRLRMVNGNGDSKYSSVVYIKTREESSIGIKCNTVFRNLIDVVMQTEKEEAIAVHLFNGSGKLVRYIEVQGKKGANFIQLDNVQSLANGTYILQLKQGGEMHTRKLIKQ